MPYRRDADGVWRAPNGGSLDFSDGDEVEDRLLRLIGNAADLSCGSMELASAACDWPTHYHLSPQRVDLLRPLRPLFSGPVLEIGAGCGALTRYLGECDVPVVAVEGSARRAHIAALRCRDLPNVEVVADGFEAFRWPETFQTVLLVGVLEYSRLFMGGADPVAAMLNRAAEFLAPGGALVLAIENQLGLKYFAGAPEDHLGIPFLGINDSYRVDSVVTFGRLELERRLNSAGFARSEFFYPWPDYKFPVAILHPAAFHDAYFSAATLIRQYAAPDQAVGYPRFFAEEMAWPLLVRNGLVKDMANSFLVVAWRGEQGRSLLESTTLASIYATRRRPCFAKETSLLRSGGELEVRRRALHGLPVPAGLPFQQVLTEEDFLQGVPLADDLYGILNRPDWQNDDIVRWAAPWVAFLHAHSWTGEGGGHYLPPEFVDCTPFNLMRGPDGQLRPFDQEWVAQAPLALPWVVFRGLLWSIANLKSVARPLAGTAENILQLVGHVMQALDLVTAPRDLEDFLSQEEKLYETVSGGSGPDIRKGWERLTLNCRQTAPVALLGEDQQVTVLNRNLTCLQEQMARLKKELARRHGRIRHLEEQVMGQSAALQEIRGTMLWRTRQKILAVFTNRHRRRPGPVKESD